MPFFQTTSIFYAHTHPEFENIADAKAHWEPLFTPFGIVDLSDPRKACAGLNGEYDSEQNECPHCKNKEPFHGHLNKVAFWTATFAKDMLSDNHPDSVNLARWGYITGLWHDLGKFSLEFQEYLQKASDPHRSEMNQKIDHTTAGAKLAVSKHSVLGHFIANAIAGHHAGLLDSRNINNVAGASIENRLNKEYGDDLPNIFPHSQVTDYDLPALPKFLKQGGFACATFQRLLFSCLVDADFLCTEAFMNAKQSELRQQPTHDFLTAWNLLHKKINSFPKTNDPVNLARRQVFQDCIQAAENTAPFFSLTVPTGGGKTLSSMAFALQHAIRNQKKKIIYVIPFTSIIEQNAQVFQETFSEMGEGYVLEHHSNLSPDKETLEIRLSCENWESSVIITTAVQFYESLFAHRTSQTRKLHNIANSVVIFDEAQNLPINYLKPCLEILKTLSSDYAVTSVLCTATQPAIQQSEHLPFGLENIQEIIQHVPVLFENLERTKLIFRGQMADDDIFEELENQPQALIIVNTKKHAQSLAERLEQPHAYHLSTSMCPQHRKEILSEVRQRLVDDQPVILISTQLIEAGVDVDFPLVYRSLAGLDSMSQAAGRCNRNGKHPISNVHIFKSEHDNESYFSTVKNIGSEILNLYSESPLEPKAIQNYFDKYYLELKETWDKEKIMDDFEFLKSADLPLKFQYKTASEKFKLIKEETIPIFIPYDDESKKLLRDLRNPSVNLHRQLFRKLQAYSVQVRSKPFEQFKSEFESLRDGQFYALIEPKNHYNQKYGLDLKSLTISDYIQ